MVRTERLFGRLVLLGALVVILATVPALGQGVAAPPDERANDPAAAGNASASSAQFERGSIATADGGIYLSSVFARSDDHDGDGLTTRREAFAGTSPNLADTDSDGLSDRAEIDRYGTDPTVADVDRHGLLAGEGFYLDSGSAAPDVGDGVDVAANSRKSSLTSMDVESTDPPDPEELAPALVPTDPVADGSSDGSETAIPEHLPPDYVSEFLIQSLPPITLVSAAIGFLAGLVGAGTVLLTRDHLGKLSAPIRSSLFRFASAWTEIPAADSGSPDSSARDDAVGGYGVGDEEFVPDEVLVEELLRGRKGRMKQSAIVELTDWSKAKVSRLLSSMSEQGRIVKVRLGRENLICLKGEEPEVVARSHPT